MSTYAERLKSLTEQRGALCVGIDPHPQILAAWGLDDDVRGLETCARTMVEALGPEVAVFKPQSAFYEVHGSAGIAVLERVLADIRDAGALSILDVKRGDIGSTMAGYARAYLTDESPLRADAITLSPYLGFESLRPAIDLAHQHGRGLYLLARTSNPEGGDVQLATASAGGSVAQLIVDQAAAENQASGQYALGLVVGGTHADPGCDVSAFNGSILVPGIGAQGGTIEGLREIFGDAVGKLLPSASRQVMRGGPGVDGLRAALRELLGRG
ncbi:MULTISPECIES: orotidine-5'-phosphate decarboxylase [unclassified Luteococcus]|uniref:orotidine-5'-phosphate decarboxylase n=1 Tax=unclassified Luteococcus TaxID=2639923 RepID=UPI00313AED05